MTSITHVSKAGAVLALAVAFAIALSATPAHAAGFGDGTIEVTGQMKSGTAHPSDFTVRLVRTSPSGGGSSEAQGDTIMFGGLTPGVYQLSKTAGPSGYSVAWSGDCNAQGSVIISVGTQAECTATYAYAPTPPRGGSGGGSTGTVGRGDRTQPTRPTR